MGRHPALTPEQRLAVVRQSEKQPEWKQKQLGQWAADVFQLDFVPSQPTISIVLRQGGRPVKVRGPKKARGTRPKVVKCPQVEKQMLQWLDKQIEKDEAVSVTAVQTKAKELVHQLKAAVDGFVVSDTWVDSFMRRHVLNCPFGLSDSEATDVEEDAEVVGVASKKTAKKEADTKDKAGKTSRRVAKVLVAKTDSRTPVTANVAPPAGKRKRDGQESEPEKRAKAHR
ncbi:hypothetical protein PRNP1_000099 [Phytophthora ramorum]